MYAILTGNISFELVSIPVKEVVKKVAVLGHKSLTDALKASVK
jgi:hypothetical protein